MDGGHFANMDGNYLIQKNKGTYIRKKRNKYRATDNKERKKIQIWCIFKRLWNAQSLFMAKAWHRILLAIGLLSGGGGGSGNDGTT